MSLAELIDLSVWPAHFLSISALILDLIEINAKDIL